ncbi:MAG: hypothetical protein QOG53_3137 [Frankiales bacterium]|jgi:hypothetical protein|nr:hypothetical protein [Frankiales bacterium]
MRAEQAADARQAILHVLSLHETEFPEATRQIAPDPPPVDPHPIIKRHRKQATKGISIFARKARTAAKQAADAAAAAEVKTISASDAKLQAAYQAEFDDTWRQLTKGVSDVVLAQLAQAFEDNDAAAAPVGVSRGEASVITVVPNAEDVPDSKPSTTTAGNPTTKKLTKQERADLYLAMVAGYILVTVKEAFAVAPTLKYVRIVAVRDPGPDAYGHQRVEPILAAKFARGALLGVQWRSIDAPQIMSEIAADLVVNVLGRNKELATLDLRAEPDIAKLIAKVDVGELLD